MFSNATDSRKTSSSLKITAFPFPSSSPRAHGLFTLTYKKKFNSNGSMISFVSIILFAKEKLDFEGKDKY